MKIYCSRDKNNYILNNIDRSHWVRVKLGRYRNSNDDSLILFNYFKDNTWIKIIKIIGNKYYFAVLFDNRMNKTLPAFTCRDQSDRELEINFHNSENQLCVADIDNIEVVQPVEIASDYELFGALE